MKNSKYANIDDYNLHEIKEVQELYIQILGKLKIVGLSHDNKLIIDSKKFKMYNIWEFSPSVDEIII